MKIRVFGTATGDGYAAPFILLADQFVGAPVHPSGAQWVHIVTVDTDDRQLAIGSTGMRALRLQGFYIREDEQAAHVLGLSRQA